MLVNTNKYENESYIIFSTSEEFVEVKNILGLDVTPLVGCYKGKEEKSYITNADNWELVYYSPLLNGEESVLHLGPVDDDKQARPSVLQYLTPVPIAPAKTATPIEFLGYWWTVSMEEALKHDAWTKKGASYFITAFDDPVRKEKG